MMKAARASLIINFHTRLEVPISSISEEVTFRPIVASGQSDGLI